MKGSKEEMCRAIRALKDTKIMKEFYSQEHKDWVDDLKKHMPEMTPAEKLLNIFE